MHISYKGHQLGAGLIPRLGWGWAENTNVYIKKWSSFRSVSTPSFCEWHRRRENWKPSAIYSHLRIQIFFFFFCKISKYFKSGSISLHVALAKQNTCSVCLRKLLTGSGVQLKFFPLAQNILERSGAPRMRRKLETQNMRDEKLNTMNPRGAICPL